MIFFFGDSAMCTPFFLPTEGLADEYTEGEGKRDGSFLDCCLVLDGAQRSPGALAIQMEREREKEREREREMDMFPSA